MVIYLDNKHVAPLQEGLRYLLNGAMGEEEAALRAALSAIEQETQKSPYRLWLRANPTKEKTS